MKKDDISSDLLSKHEPDRHCFIICHFKEIFLSSQRLNASNHKAEKTLTKVFMLKLILLFASLLFNMLFERFDNLKILAGTSYVLRISMRLFLQFQSEMLLFGRISQFSTSYEVKVVKKQYAFMESNDRF